jgi:hypothetical protein
MTAENEEIPLPRCPHCSAELPGVGLFNWQSGVWLIFCVYCPNLDCRKTIHLQIAPMGIPAQEADSSIIPGKLH